MITWRAGDFLVIGIAMLMGPATAQALTFTDGDFGVGWQDSFIVEDDPTTGGTGPGTSTGTITRLTSGGNPGPFREHVHNFDSGDTLYTVGVNSSAAYDPGVSGAIATIDLQIDLRDPGGGSTGISLVLEQDSTLFFSPIGAFTSNVFTPFQPMDLIASDFETNPNNGLPGAILSGLHPDFSDTGSPIAFGYALGNRVVGSGSLTNTLGADNWMVTVNPVPEPGTLSLVALGLVSLRLFGAQARRRART